MRGAVVGGGGCGWAWGVGCVGRALGRGETCLRIGVLGEQGVLDRARFASIETAVWKLNVACRRRGIRRTNTHAHTGSLVRCWIGVVNLDIRTPALPVRCDGFDFCQHFLACSICLPSYLPDLVNPSA